MQQNNLNNLENKTKIYLATTNKGKADSFRVAFEKYFIDVEHVSLHLEESRAQDVITIAKEKVTYAHELLLAPVITIDAGFRIDGLKGDNYPGTYINVVLKEIGIEGILNLKHNQSNRSCEFVKCTAYMDTELTTPACFISTVKGELATKVSGEFKEHLWSPLGLIFIPDGYKKTEAEMSYEEYHKFRESSGENKTVSQLAGLYLRRCAKYNLG